jgi:hypothetical protein
VFVFVELKQPQQQINLLQLVLQVRVPLVDLNLATRQLLGKTALVEQVQISNKSKLLAMKSLKHLMMEVIKFRAQETCCTFPLNSRE